MSVCVQRAGGEMERPRSLGLSKNIWRDQGDSSQVDVVAERQLIS